jgi:hypothetical protein
MKYIITALLISTQINANAQNLLIPDENVFEKKFIRKGTYEMAYTVDNNGQQLEIGTYKIEINPGVKNLSVYTLLTVAYNGETWADTSIADANTFSPVYRSSFNKTKEFVLNYGKEVTGYYLDKQTNKRNTIKEPVKESFFDNYAYPHLLGMLPLTTGYKKDIAVYEYTPGNSSNVKRAYIEEVKSNIHVSSLTGEHKVWLVNVWEEVKKERYMYYVDKDTRRLWKVEIFSNGQHIILLDKETDFNPFTNKFDKDATLPLIKNGTGIILGRAFARDNQAPIKGIAVLNMNKKQYAGSGTSIILIPYTAFFKEWVKLNEASRKKGRAIPLPKEAAECIKVSTVYDDEGNFEFTGLMPGDYLLYTEFGYVHTGSRTEVVGYTDTYINGMFLGSTARTNTYSYNTNATAGIKKIVTISKEGEKISVKLKKTL